MPKAIFSKRAQKDLNAIDEYTEATWGIEQADRYLDKIHAFCQLLAETPGMGRSWNEQRPHSRRIEHESHVIFYRESPEGILVVRVLHRRMLTRKNM